MSENTEVQTKRRMTKGEAAVKKRLFAEYMLEIGDQRKSRAEVIQLLDLPPSTYDAWAADPKMAEWAGIETWRYSEAAKHYVRINQGTALRTLVDVMKNSPNDNARVRAAETFLTVADGVSETKVDSTADEVAKLLSSRQPTLIVGNINIQNNNIQQQAEDGDDYEVVDAPVRLLPADTQGE